MSIKYSLLSKLVSLRRNEATEAILFSRMENKIATVAFGGLAMTRDYRFICLVLIFFSILSCAVQPADAQTPISSAPQQTLDSTASSEEALDFRDPFLSALPAKPKKPEKGPIQETVEAQPEFDTSALKVSGLVWGTDKPKAIIDGAILGIGDTVAEAKIIDINKDGILLEYNGKELLAERSKILE